MLSNGPTWTSRGRFGRGNLPDPVKTGLMPVDNVQGISMKSRVIWLRSVQTI